LIPGLRRSPGEGNSNPFQYSFLEKSMDRETWRATVYGGCKELAMIERVHEHTHTHVGYYFSHFTDEETEEVQLGKVTCLRKHSRKIRIRP